MKKAYRLDGVDCANCAAKMENAIAKLDGVSSTSVNFMTRKLIVEAEEEKMPLILESAAKIIKKIEPDVVMKKA